jgi:hypothetical protein
VGASNSHNSWASKACCRNNVTFFKKGRLKDVSKGSVLAHQQHAKEEVRDEISKLVNFIIYVSCP